MGKTTTAITWLPDSFQAQGPILLLDVDLNRSFWRWAAGLRWAAGHHAHQPLYARGGGHQARRNDRNPSQALDLVKSMEPGRLGGMIGTPSLFHPYVRERSGTIDDFIGLSAVRRMDCCGPGGQSNRAPAATILAGTSRANSWHLADRVLRTMSINGATPIAKTDESCGRTKLM
jgi:hypothetical protein